MIRLKANLSLNPKTNQRIFISILFYPLISMTAGCISGAIEEIITWPMEYMKTQLQLQQLKTPSLASLDAGYYVDGSEDGDGIIRIPVQEEGPLFTDMTTGFIHTVKNHGFFALYYALTPTLIGSMPRAGIRFGLFAWFSNLLRADGRSSEILFYLGLYMQNVC
mmetsp:Transcript_44000/g.49926  ORF Transcript_44000/g.49926 Transcript_44000/m.49926 type:complete len:164 (+) Transcript_44000:81-572(+)